VVVDGLLFSIACFDGHDEVVSLLHRRRSRYFNKKTNVSMISFYNIKTYSALFYFYSIVSFLIDRLEVAYLPLRLLDNKRRLVVFVFLERGAEFLSLQNTKCVEFIYFFFVGCTADVLSHAAVREGVDVVSSLLSRGVDINGINLDGDTALMRACYGGNEAVVSLLIERGANIEIKNKVRCVPCPLSLSISCFLS